MIKFRIFGASSATGIGIHSQSIYQIGVKYENSKYQFEFYNSHLHTDIENALSTTKATDINLFFFAESFAKQFLGVKIYYAVFESSRPTPGYNSWFDRFDYIFSPSKWGKECMIAYGLPAEKIFVIPEGVDPYLYHPFAKKNRNIGDPFRIFMLGKYEPRKGYEVALEAFRIAFKQYPLIELSIKADWATPSGGLIPQEFHNLVNNFADLPIVLMSGTVASNEIAELYRRADLFLFPSLCEGWGLPLIEAIACGVPVVSSDYGGQSEFLMQIENYYFKIPHETNPIWCSKWKQTYVHADLDWGNWAKIDPVKLAECIIKAINTDNREYLGRRASEVIRFNFSWNRVVDEIIYQVENITATITSNV